MTETFQCPAEGCDYTGVRNSVAAHYSGKADDAHKGGYETAKHLLGEQGSAESSGSKDSGSGEQGSNPAFAGPEGSDSAATDGGGENQVELPCGCESVDISAEPWSSQIEEHGAARARCDTCGEEAYLYP